MARALDLLSAPEAEEYAEALGEIFGVEFDDDAVEQWRTAGDILRAVEARIGEGAAAGPSLSVKAFYVLRRAVGDRRIGPSTPLSAIAGTWRATTFLVRMHRRTKLVMPGAPTGEFGRAAMTLTALTFATVFILWIALGGGGTPACGGSEGLIALPVLFGGLGIAVAFGYWDGRAFRADIKTFGDLARAAALLNVGALSGMGASLRRDDVWRALRSFLSIVAMVPAEEIERCSPLGEGCVSGASTACAGRGMAGPLHGRSR